MGAIFTKWKRAASSKETLENLQNELDRLSRERQSSQQCERTLIGLLLVVFLIGYPLGCALGYLFLVHWGSTTGQQLLFALGAICFPIICYAEKRLLTLYCSHRKSQYDSSIQNVKSDKKKVLDEVMEKEPYRVAKELLEKYDPSHAGLQPTTPQPQQQGLRRRPGATPMPRPQAPPTPHPALIHQTNRAAAQQRPIVQETPSRPRPPAPSSVAPSTPLPQQQNNSAFIPPGHALGPAPGPPTPVPILPRNRSTMDKLTDFLVGDGPGSRYALICGQCCSHNGMALKDEFEYTAFRCAYCYHLNPARQRKPPVPSSSSSAASSQPAESNQVVEVTDKQEQQNVDRVSQQQSSQVQQLTDNES